MERIVEMIDKMSARFNSHEIFQDWIKMFAISISNQVIFNKNFEEQYLSISKKYSKEELMNMCQMSAILTELFENEISDYLGEIYMKLEAGSSKTGQFFTPFHVAEMMSQIALSGYKGVQMPLNEPSCGGGANILATAKCMKKMGYNYQELIETVAQDLDFKCVYMCYVQLSLAGINAVVIQGDTLMEQKNVKLFTPMYVLKGGFKCKVNL